MKPIGVSLWALVANARPTFVNTIRILAWHGFGCAGLFVPGAPKPTYTQNIPVLQWTVMCKFGITRMRLLIRIRPRIDQEASNRLTLIYGFYCLTKYT